MVTAPILLLIAVTTAPDGLAMMKETAAACVQTLPSGTTTVVRQLSALPDDAKLGADAAEIGATATVIVTWRDAAGLVSDVRLLLPPSVARGGAQTTIRTVVFSVRDLPAERGRALGLIVGAMLDEAWGTGARAGPGRRDLDSGSIAVASIDAEVPRVSVAPSGQTSPAPQWGLEASVVTAVDRQEDFDDSIGGMIALRRALRPHLAARIGLGLRVADLDGADATARSTLAELGLVWSSEGFGRPAGLGFGARIDLLGAHEAIKRAGDDDRRFEEVWSAGADVLGQVGLGLSAGTTLLLSAGAEVVLTDARLAAPDQPTAELPWDRLILEVGVLSRF